MDIKKWKNIFKVTLSIFIIFIWIVVFIAISSYTEKVNYPYPALGIDINNWFEKFCLTMGFTLYVIGIPLIINIVLLIISAIKIKKKENKKFRNK